MIRCLQVGLLLLIALGASRSFAAKEQRVAVGQGISAPISRTAVNFANGFTYENSAVAASMTKAALTLEADTGDNESTGQDDTGLGGEFSVGTGNAGLALGYYTRDCDNCDGRFGAIGGVSVSQWAFGFGYREEDQYSAGLLWNRKGNHRAGVTLDWAPSDTTDEDVSSFGLGYSYHGQGFVFALDGSTRSSDNDDIILVTPGLEVHADKWGLSVSYNAAFNDDSNSYDENVWFGVGYRGNTFEVAAYHDYQNEWSLAVSFIF